MTRKDALIAKALAAWKNSPEAGYGSDSAVKEAAGFIADALEHPKFDRGRFLFAATADDVAK